MKSLRYLLIVVTLVSALSIEAHMFDKTWGQKPVVEMHSTSSMAYSGSTLPQAAATGVTLATVSDVETTTRPYHPGHIRRDVGGGGTTEDDEDPDNPGEPAPIGDVLLPLMLLVLAYSAFVARKKRAL